jgi:glycerol-3-phosphate dehydrogenase
MLYDFLAQKSPLPSHQSLSSIDVSRQCPALKSADLKGGFVYYDAQMEDEQLVFANIQAGTDLGLTALQECECLGFIQSTDQVTGINVSYQDKTHSVYGRCILNASGPWVDRVANLSTLEPISPYLSPTKGVHIVIPSLGLIQALILESPLDGRIFFIIPWKGKTLIGTTDTPFDGNPDDVTTHQDDIDYLINSANFYLQHHSISKSDIVDTFAGLRPLQYSTKYSSNRSRDFSLVRSKDHLFHLFGGKYTSYRYIAEVVVNDLVKECDLSCSASCKTHLTPL